LEPDPARITADKARVAAAITAGSGDKAPVVQHDGYALMRDAIKGLEAVQSSSGSAQSGTPSIQLIAEEPGSKAGRADVARSTGPGSDDTDDEDAEKTEPTEEANKAIDWILNDKKDDFWGILQVEPKSQETTKTRNAFREMGCLLHPDFVSGKRTEDAFKSESF
jgi:hypothetical protein